MQEIYLRSLPERRDIHLLLIGFGPTVEQHILGLPTQNPYLHITHEDNFELARRRLLQGAARQLTQVVLFEARWCLDDRSRLLQFLAQHADLQSIPAIVLTERSSHINGAQFLAKGADDCYTSPVAWPMLAARIAGLLDFKPQRDNDIAQTATPAERPAGLLVQWPKRAFDVLVAATALVVLSPVLLLVALAIRLESPGPVLYRSRRIGAGYQQFDFWKFRSMFADADRRLQEMLSSNQYADTTFVKFQNDPRVTRVGRFIRKYSIDELPQLFNILRGDMSLVGNRPLPTYEAEQLTTEQSCARFLAPAGLTGLWQVSKRGHSNMSAAERIELDVQYAEQHSFRMDADILLRTFTAFVQKENV
jgi:lipopolysaccharide/colanic/teichoic acid biosynthesis glycosyltransferase